MGALSLTSCSPTRAIDAVKLLADLAGGGEPGRPQDDPIVPTPITFEGGSGFGDLYWPDRAEAALVLVPGVVPKGKDDPRLVALARSLTRAGFAVLVPAIPNLRAQQVSPEDADAIAAAIAHLSTSCGLPAGIPSVGVMAISYAAGPAILAALQPGTAGQVRYLVAIGGYYDAEAVLTFFTTGYFRAAPGEPWQHRTPNAYGKWVFVRANAERLDDPDDRAALAEMATRKLEDPDADVTDLKARLGPEGRTITALLDNRDPDRVPELIAALPEPIRADLAALDLARRDLSQLQARLILVHGRDDPIIPSTESAKLAAAVPPGQARLYVVDSLAHVEVDLTGLVDGFKLWRAIYALLSERDAAPAPERSACLAPSGVHAARPGSGGTP